MDYAGEELVFLTVSLVDGSGVPVAAADEVLTASVEGAELLGFGSGDPRPLFNYNEQRTKTWKGRAQIILKKRDHAAVHVSVCSDSGKTAQIAL